MMYLDNVNHTYHDDDGNTYISVTTLLSKEFPFDAKSVAGDVIHNKHSKYYGMKAQSVLDQWADKTSKGSIVHKVVEDFIKQGIIPPEGKNLAALDKFRKLNFKGKLLSETLVADKALLIAGTVDILEEYPDYYWIWDIKRCGKIDYEKLLKYSAQLEFYKRLVEKYLNKRAIVGGILWFKEIDNGYDLKVLKTFKCNDVVDRLIFQRKNELTLSE